MYKDAEIILKIMDVCFFLFYLSDRNMHISVSIYLFRDTCFMYYVSVCVDMLYHFTRRYASFGLICRTCRLPTKRKWYKLKHDLVMFNENQLKFRRQNRRLGIYFQFVIICMTLKIWQNHQKDLYIQRKQEKQTWVDCK